MRIADLYEPMQKYFRDITDLAKTPGARFKKKIASIAELCQVLEMSKPMLMSMRAGNADEQKFFNDMLLEYEVCINAMRTASLITDKERMELLEIVKEEGPDSDKIVNVIFDKWNAPEDWEDYEDFKAILDENGLSFRQGKKVLEKALKDVK